MADGDWLVQVCSGLDCCLHRKAYGVQKFYRYCRLKSRPSAKLAVFYNLFSLVCVWTFFVCFCKSMFHFQKSKRGVRDFFPLAFFILQRCRQAKAVGILLTFLFAFDQLPLHRPPHPNVWRIWPVTLFILSTYSFQGLSPVWGHKWPSKCDNKVERGGTCL